MDLKKSNDLLATTRQIKKQLEEIRWCEWPTIGLGIGLKPERLERLIKGAEHIIRELRKERSNGINDRT